MIFLKNFGIFLCRQVVVLYIGVNDCRDRTPAKEIKKRMEVVVKWVLKNMPDSKIVLQALLPGLSEAEEVNKKYEKLAKKYNLKFSTCGTEIKKQDRSYYMFDKLHPNLAGQNLWLSCLREKVVQPLLEDS